MSNTADYGKKSFYEIYPLTFADGNGDGIGDIQGIISKLPYIKSLGFEGIWINPLYVSAWKDGGYDIIDPFRIDPRFGTNEDAERLIATAHELGITVFFDLVPGHLSWLNPLFIKSGEATRNSFSNLFIWTDREFEDFPDAEGNLVHGLFPRIGSFYVNFFVHQPAINYGFARIDYPSWQHGIDSEGAAKGRAFLVSIMEFWLGLGVDGFRVDMADSLVKNDDDKKATIETWHRIRAEVLKKFPDFKMVSEWSNPARSFAAGFDSDFVLDHEDNFSHAFFRAGDGYCDSHPEQKPLLAEFSQELWDRFAKEMNDEVLTAQNNPGHWLSPISGNHDTWRIADSLKGNSLRLAYLMLFTLPGVPFVFAGDEAGQTTIRNLPSKEGGYQRTGARLPMKWDDSNATHGFSSADKVALYLPQNSRDATVATQKKDGTSVLSLIRKLNSLRKSDADLVSATGFVLLPQPLSYRRGKTLVAMNLKNEPLHLKVGQGQVLLAIGNYQEAAGEIVLPLHSAVILKEED